MAFTLQFHKCTRDRDQLIQFRIFLNGKERIPPATHTHESQKLAPKTTKNSVVGCIFVGLWPWCHRAPTSDFFQYRPQCVRENESGNCVKIFPLLIIWRRQQEKSIMIISIRIKVNRYVGAAKNSSFIWLLISSSFRLVSLCANCAASQHR